MSENRTPASEGEPRANATWSRMLAGNRRFFEGQAEHPWQDAETRESLIDAQSPDAVVLSCSDSRVPPEIIFDQGLGDLFTVRTAGQTLDPSVLASLEFAITELKVSLLVVMGHEHCGAVTACLQAIEDHRSETGRTRIEPGDEALDETFVHDSPSPIVNQVGTSILAAQEASLETTDEYESVHIARTIEVLVDRSEVIRQAVAEGRIMMVGARYSLTSGKVQVLSF